jgi:hypothetical protein
MCTRESPCGTLNDGVNANKPTVKVAAGIVAGISTTIIDGKALTILGDPGAKLSRINEGVLLDIRDDGADVKIFDLEITGATGAGNPAISIPVGGAPRLTLTRVTVDGNQGTGISIFAGTLTMLQSTVNTNTGFGVSVTSAAFTMSRSVVSLNTAGGIVISGSQFDISNCLIVENGGATSPLGGIDISKIGIGTPTGIHRLAFTTIAYNLGPPNVALNTGVNCTTIGTLLTFDSNIIYGNAVNGGGQQLGGSTMCAASYSDVGPDAATGTGNINMPPMFANAAQGDFHLASSSPAKDVADPGATLLDDIDGDTRPQGPRRDMGADEIKQ